MRASFAAWVDGGVLIDDAQFALGRDFGIAQDDVLIKLGNMWLSIGLS